MSGYESLDVVYKQRPSVPLQLRRGEAGESISQDNIALHHVAEKAERWTHVDNLDEFFTRIYEYHQHHGFLCMVLSELFELVQFVFVVSFTTFLLECVDYPILFKDKLPANFTSQHQKVSLADAIHCVPNFSPPVVACLIVAVFFWLHRFLRFLYRSMQWWEIRNFYRTELSLGSAELNNLTWHELQERLSAVQKQQHLCIHKDELTELDIYQRILRYKNYVVAMVNKKLLPPRLHVPFLGECVFFTNGFKGDFKRKDKRTASIEELRKVALWFGIINLLFSPVIIIWQLLYSFFSYAELIKREPSFLGARRWSIYGRYYFRHFNELNHELEMRLSRGYRPSAQYMDLFVSNILEIIAKNVAFFVGGLLAVLLALTAYDEDVIQVEHVLTAMTLCGIVIVVCRTFIADENIVWCPELLMNHILAHVHYLPDYFRGFAHTEKVRAEFAQMFQYKAVFLLEELLSPLITPFFLCMLCLVLLFWFRPRAAEFVDFFRNFTVEVPGLGDVCSFAQMDIARHGNPKWQVNCDSIEGKFGDNVDGYLYEATNYDSDAHAEAPLVGNAKTRAPNLQDSNEHVPADLGKTEMSLVHFTVTNPSWIPPEPTERFLTGLRERAAHDVEIIHEQQQSILDNPLWHSVSSITAAPVYPSPAFGLPSLQTSNVGLWQTGANDFNRPGSSGLPYRKTSHAADSETRSDDLLPPLRGRGISRMEGPMEGYESVPQTAAMSNVESGTGTGGLGLASMIQSAKWGRGGQNMPFGSITGAGVNETMTGAFRGVAAEMSLSVLYLHELHHRKLARQQQSGRYGSMALGGSQDAQRNQAATPTDRSRPNNDSNVTAPPNNWLSQQRLWEVPEVISERVPEPNVDETEFESPQLFFRAP